MILIRKQDGSTIKVDEPAFVELVNETDNTVGLVFCQPRPGVVLQIPPGSMDAGRYEGMFRKKGVKFAKHIINRG